jgi:hypothetical protein
MTIHEIEKRVEEIAEEQSEMGEAVRYLVAELESLKKRVATVEQRPTPKSREREVQAPRSIDVAPSFRLAAPEDQQTIRRTIHSNDAGPTIVSSEPGPVLTRKTEEQEAEI